MKAQQIAWALMKKNGIIDTDTVSTLKKDVWPRAMGYMGRYEATHALGGLEEYRKIQAEYQASLQATGTPPKVIQILLTQL